MAIVLKKKDKLIAGIGAACLALGAGGGYAGLTLHQNSERDGRISELVAVFKERCQPVKTEQSCFYEPPALESSAKLHEASGNIVEAGLVYARMSGRQDEARKMAEKCEQKGDKDGATRIREELSARAIAIERYIEAQNAPSKGPAAAASR